MTRQQISHALFEALVQTQTDRDREARDTYQRLGPNATFISDYAYPSLSRKRVLVQDRTSWDHGRWISVIFEDGSRMAAAVSEVHFD